jgi:hypothetical protein
MALNSLMNGSSVPSVYTRTTDKSLTRPQPNPFALFSQSAPSRERLGAAARGGWEGGMDGSMVGNAFGPPEGYAGYTGSIGNNAASRMSTPEMEPIISDLQQKRLAAIDSGDYATADQYTGIIKQAIGGPGKLGAVVPGVIAGVDAWTTMPWGVFGR